MFKRFWEALRKAFNSFEKLFSPAPAPAPRRRVLRRVVDDLGNEDVDLECGHKLRIKRYLIDSVPCEDCKLYGKKGQ